LIQNRQGINAANTGQATASDGAAPSTPASSSSTSNYPKSMYSTKESDMTSEHKQLWRTLLSRVRLIVRTTSRGSAEEVAATGELAAAVDWDLRWIAARVSIARAQR
jgi:hypothetical protein